MTLDHRAWAKRQLRQLVALGIPFSDAARNVRWVLDTAPEGVDLDAWIPTPAQVEALATVTDADVMDARADWIQHETGMWRFILDAVETP